MSNPISTSPDGIHFNPDLMEKEKLYHCIFADKVYLIYKDSQDMLNCYEIDEQELVEKIKNSKDIDIEKLIQDYTQNTDLKN